MADDTKRELEAIRRDAERLKAPAPPVRLGMGKLVVPAKRPPRPELRSSPVHEPTVPGGAAPMAPKAAPEPPQHLDTLKGMGPRKDSPPPFSRPPPVSEPTTALEREVVRLRAEMASLVDAREKAAKAVPAWVEPPWWRTTGGMVKVLGALFAGLASLGVGGWLASRPEEKPKAPAVTDVACPKFEDQDAPRSALCMRINQLEGSIGKLEAVDAARRERDSRIRKMLGELPEVKTKENP